MSKASTDNQSSKHPSVNIHNISGLKNGVIEENDENMESYDPNVPYDPYDHIRVEKGINYLEALIHMLNSVCGVGFISAPYTFSHFGNLPSVIAACLLSVVVLTSQRLLLKCMYEMCRRRHVPYLNFSSAIREGIFHGPKFLHKFSKFLSYSTNIYLAVYHLFLGALYILVAAQNLRDLLRPFVHTANLYVFMLLQLPFLIMAVFIKNLKALTIFSALGVIFLTACLITVTTVLVNDLPPFSENYIVRDINNTPIAILCIIFVLSAPGVAMAVQREMSKPKRFLSLFGINNVSTVLSLLYLCGFSFLAVWHFGAATSGNILNNLKRKGTISIIATVFSCLSLYLTYPLQLYPIIHLLWYDHLQKYFLKDFHTIYLVSTHCIVVATTLIIACLTPNYDTTIPSITCFCLMFLCYIYPAILDYCLYYQRSDSIAIRHKIIDFCLFVFGCTVIVVGVAAVIYNWIIDAPFS